jgi:hypothetical protein
MKFHHLGIYVDNINDTIFEFRKIIPTIKTSKVFAIKTFKVKVIFCLINKNTTYEFIEPYSKNNPLYLSHKKKKISLHHTAYTVKNLDKSILKLRNLGYMPISKTVYAESFNTKITFLINKLNIITELIEGEPKILFK